MAHVGQKAALHFVCAFFRSCFFRQLLPVGQLRQLLQLPGVDLANIYVGLDGAGLSVLQKMDDVAVPQLLAAVVIDPVIHGVFLFPGLPCVQHTAPVHAGKIGAEILSRNNIGEGSGHQGFVVIVKAAGVPGGAAAPKIAPGVALWEYLHAVGGAAQHCPAEFLLLICPLGDQLFAGDVVYHSQNSAGGGATHPGDKQAYALPALFAAVVGIFCLCIHAGAGGIEGIFQSQSVSIGAFCVFRNDVRPAGIHSLPAGVAPLKYGAYGVGGDVVFKGLGGGFLQGQIQQLAPGIHFQQHIRALLGGFFRHGADAPLIVGGKLAGKGLHTVLLAQRKAAFHPVDIFRGHYDLCRVAAAKLHGSEIYGYPLVF